MNYCPAAFPVFLNTNQHPAGNRLKNNSQNIFKGLGIQLWQPELGPLSPGSSCFFAGQKLPPVLRPFSASGRFCRPPGQNLPGNHHQLILVGRRLMPLADRPMTVAHRPMPLVDRLMLIGQGSMTLVKRLMTVVEQPMTVARRLMTVGQRPMTVVERVMTVAHRLMPVVDRPLPVVHRILKNSV
jgi:hypothetical protein